LGLVWTAVAITSLALHIEARLASFKSHHAFAKRHRPSVVGLCGCELARHLVSDERLPHFVNVGDDAFINFLRIEAIDVVDVPQEVFDGKSEGRVCRTSGEL